jgi:hypothetical protein
MEVRKVKRTSPKRLVIYGAPKVGKSTQMTKLDNALIIDTEQGYDFLAGKIFEAKSLSDIAALKKELIEYAKENNGKVPYDYVVLDTIDNLVLWFEHKVAKDNNVQTHGDLEYGKGYMLVRNKVMDFLSFLEKAFPYVIVVGHLKRREIGSESGMVVSPDTLDLSGRLKGMIMSWSDANGIVYHEDGQLIVNFESDPSASDAGIRCPHLVGKRIPFEWESIYTD